MDAEALAKPLAEKIAKGTAELAILIPAIAQALVLILGEIRRCQETEPLEPVAMLQKLMNRRPGRARRISKRELRRQGLTPYQAAEVYAEMQHRFKLGDYDRVLGDAV